MNLTTKPNHWSAFRFFVVETCKVFASVFVNILVFLTIKSATSFYIWKYNKVCFTFKGTTSFHNGLSITSVYNSIKLSNWPHIVMVIWLSSDSNFRVLKAKYIVFLSYKNLEFFWLLWGASWKSWSHYIIQSTPFLSTSNWNFPCQLQSSLLMITIWYTYLLRLDHCFYFWHISPPQIIPPFFWVPPDFWVPPHGFLLGASSLGSVGMNIRSPLSFFWGHGYMFGVHFSVR